MSRTVKRACANRMTLVCNDATVRKSPLSQESPLTAVVPKPSEQRSSATKRIKAKEVLNSQTCNNVYKGKKGSTDLSDFSLLRWHDDVAKQQGVNRGSCQVTVIVVVTGIDVSPTGSRNFSGDLTLGTLSRSLFS